MTGPIFPWWVGILYIALYPFLWVYGKAKALIGRINQFVRGFLEK